MLYNMCHGLIHIGGEFSDYFSCADSRIRAIVAGCIYSFVIWMYVFFYSEYVVPVWNGLPEAVASSPLYYSFKT